MRFGFIRGHGFESRGAIYRGWLLVIALALLCSGCATYHEEPWRWTTPYPDRTVPPGTVAPTLRYCTDAIGHREGMLPFIFEGTCCCTPSLEVLRAYQRAGHLSGWSVDALRAAYARRGVTTGDDHQQCNNLCENGPHVVKGGRCMVAPTPGTLNHEEILTGRFAMTPWDLKQVAEFGGPVPLQPIPPALGIEPEKETYAPTVRTPTEHGRAELEKDQHGS